MPEAPGMFAISWLDLRRLPVRVDAAGLGAQYVGATIRTDGVMLLVHPRWLGTAPAVPLPGHPEARTNVGGWLDRLVATLQAGARSSVGGVLVNRDGETFRVQRATRADVPAIVGLLLDDRIGATREVAEYAPYEAAYDVVARDRSHYLAVVRRRRAGGRHHAAHRVAGPVAAGHDAAADRGLAGGPGRPVAGLGTAMLTWAHARSVARRDAGPGDH